MKNRFIILIFASFLFQLCSKDSNPVGQEDQFGCIDPDAINYDSAANTDDGSCIYDQVEHHYNIEINNTGITHLVVFQSTITVLDIGDEVGLFDLNGLSNFNDCSNETGEIMVGSGIWDGDQLPIAAIGSIDNCSLGGTQFPGYQNNNNIIVRIWDISEELEYETTVIYEIGDGLWGVDLFTVISELTIQ